MYMYFVQNGNDPRINVQQHWNMFWIGKISFLFWFEDEGSPSLSLLELTCFSFTNLDLCLLQHVVFVVKFFIAWLIPDVPSDVQARVKRERFLVAEYLHNYEVEKLKKQLNRAGGGDDLCICPQTAATVKHEVLSECLT